MYAIRIIYKYIKGRGGLSAGGSQGPPGSERGGAAGSKAFLSNRFSALGRNRSGSIAKRPRSGSEEGGDKGGQSARHRWGNIAETMGKVNAELTKVKNEGNGELVKGVMAAIQTLEFNLNGISDTIFDLEETVDYLVKRDGEMSNFLESNVSGGNLVHELEKSKSYENLCKEMAESALITKVFGVDLGEEVKGRDKLIKASKKVLEGDEKKIHLGGATIVPLAQNSQLRDDVHTVPILITSKSREEKKKIDVNIRDRKYRIACHWPKSILPEINSMRDQLKLVNDGDIDLRAMDILIRPHVTGNSLTISYRSSEKRSGLWTFLESVKTPSDRELVAKFNGHQPCQSKYFQL